MYELRSYQKFILGSKLYLDLMFSANTEKFCFGTLLLFTFAAVNGEFHCHSNQYIKLFMEVGCTTDFSMATNAN